MAAGVGILRAESRPEGVDLRERHAIGLDVELARDGEERLAAEEVLREIDLALGRARQVREVERGDAEELARTLGVRGGDNRRIHPEEAVFVEETMDRHGEGVPDPGRCADHVGARAQVGHLAQELHRVRLGLDLGGRGHDHPGRLHRAAGGKALDVRGVVVEGRRGDDLDGVEGGAVAHVHEGQPRLGVAPRAHPAAHGDRLVGGRAAPEDGSDGE